MTGRSRVLVGLLAPAIVAVVVAWFLSSGRWDLVGIWIVPSVIDWPTGFGDLANVTDTADCLRAGEPLEGCDPYGRPFQPYVVLPARVLAALGLGLAQTGILGVALFTVATVTGQTASGLLVDRLACQAAAAAAAVVGRQQATPQHSRVACVGCVTT